MKKRLQAHWPRPVKEPAHHHGEAGQGEEGGGVPEGIDYPRHCSTHLCRHSWKLQVPILKGIPHTLKQMEIFATYSLHFDWCFCTFFRIHFSLHSQIWHHLLQQLIWSSWDIVAFQANAKQYRIKETESCRGGWWEHLQVWIHRIRSFTQIWKVIDALDQR